MSRFTNDFLTSTWSRLRSVYKNPEAQPGCERRGKGSSLPPNAIASRLALGVPLRTSLF